MHENNDNVARVKEAIDIVNLIERSVKLKKAGKNYQGLCPFHSEKSPSFIVSPDIQRYKCFGCGRSGDIFNFIQESENLDFPETLAKLAAEAGIEISKSNKSSKYEQIFTANSDANQFFISELSKNDTAKQYLAKRGLTQSSIDTFSIGFSGSYNSLYKFLAQNKKYDLAVLKRTGLFAERNGGLNDRFIKRITFPIKSVTGNIIGFSARQMPNDDFGPKYLNTPETEVFHKGDTLFGIYESKNSIRKDKYAILCEGQTDVIAVHALGFTNAVAPLGTGLTEGQLSLLKRYTDNIHFLFDADSAGQKAVERGFQIAVKLGFNVYSANPSPAKDIDELIQKDPLMAKKVCKPKVDAFTYLLSLQLENRDLTKLKDYNFIRNYCEELLSGVSIPSQLQFYIEKVKRLTNIELGSDKKPLAVDTEKPTTKTKPSEFLWSNKEIYFVALALKEGFIEELKKVNSKHFLTAAVKEILELLASDQDLTAQTLINHKDLSEETKELLQNIHFKIDSLPQDIGDIRLELNTTYKRIINETRYAQLENLKIHLAAAEETEDNEKVEMLVERINKLSKKLTNEG